MFETAAQDPAESLPASDFPERGRIFARLGDAGRAGFQAVPDVLLFHQAELGLRSEDLNVLLHITAHWFVPERMPFPQVGTIAKRMGVSDRTVQRSLSRLRALGLIEKAKKEKGRQVFDLTPLIERLQPLGRKRLALKALTQSPFGMA